jgi:ferredoxin--NADP+ reductase
VRTQEQIEMSDTVNAQPTTTAQAADHPYNAAITHWDDINKELAIFRVTPDSGQVPQFKPGQFATLSMPRECPPILNPDEFPAGDPRWKKLVRRQYSIASSPNERGYIEFYVVVVATGALTPKIWHKKLGTRLMIEPRIAGDFTLEGIPDGRDIVCVATGTGLAPYVSMLKTYRGQNRWRKFVIMHGVRLAEDLGYRAELEQIAKEDPSFIYVPSCTREPEGTAWTGIRGRVTTCTTPEGFQKYCGFPLDPATAHVFLCGNPEMINQVEAELKTGGFVTHTKKVHGNIHLERYW